MPRKHYNVTSMLDLDLAECRPRRTVNIQKSKEVHRKRSRIVCLVRNAKVLLSYGCNNEPTESAAYSYTSNEIRTIYFCWPCYRTLEKDRIIENGKVIKL
jgi:hypothetical protein